MQTIYITGVSGTGKTTIAKELRSRGYNAIDAERHHCSWLEKSTGKRVAPPRVLNDAFRASHIWGCDADGLKEEMAIYTGTVFIAGPTLISQEGFLDMFSTVLLLQCAPNTFISRMRERELARFGEVRGHREEVVLNSYKNIEQTLLNKQAIPVNAQPNVQEVASKIINLVLAL